jgi:hypothetical protein
MTASELLADLATQCKTILSTECVEEVGDVKRYISNVFTLGQDTNGKPIAQKRNVSWYVYDEDGSEEEAGYGDKDFVNPEDKNPTGSDLLDINGIYNNADLRKRVTGVICKNIRTTATDAVSTAWTEKSNEIVDLFMAWVASNGTIQSNGGTASDSDLEYVVITEAWSNVVTALGS